MPFSEAPPLPQGVGYGILVGVGALFAAFIVFTLRVSLNYLGERANKSEMFMVANRAVGIGLTASAVFSSWMWANETLYGAVVGYNFGMSGPFWFAAGLSFHIALMTVVGIQVKLKVPNGHTLLEIVKFRYGVPGHLVYMVFCLINNILSCSTMILAAAGAIAAITGMHPAAASMLIPVGVILYTAAGGLKATFLTDYVHTTVALILLMYFCIGIVTNEHIGGVYGLYDKVLAYTQNADHYVKGNYKGSLLSFKSQGGALFSICHNIANLGLVIMDTAFWQKSMAADLKATVPGYMIGSVLIFCVPWALGTICGLGAHVLEEAGVIDPISATALDIGNVFPIVARALLGKGASVGIVLMLFMSVTSTVSAEMIAVSSIISFDIFRTYIRPNATDRLLIFVSHAGVVFFGLLSGAIAVGFYEGGIDLNWMSYFLGIAITPGVFPVILTILWKRQSRLAAIVSPILGLATGLGVWLGTAQIYFGEISVKSTGAPLPNVWGNIATLMSSLLFSVIITLARPEDFDWLIFHKIAKVNEDDEEPLGDPEATGHIEGSDFSASEETKPHLKSESDAVTHIAEVTDRDISGTGLESNSDSEIESSGARGSPAKDPHTTSAHSLSSGSLSDHDQLSNSHKPSNALFQPRLVVPTELSAWGKFLYYIGWDTTPTDYSNHPLGPESVPIMLYWYKVAKIFAIVICLITWIVWPYSLYRNYIFSKSFFSGWVVVAIIWVFLAFIFVVIYPLYDGRKSLFKVYNGLREDWKKWRHRSKAAKDEN